MISWLLATADTGGKMLGGFRAPLLTALIASIVSYLLTPWVRSLAIGKGAIDDPNADDRRVHLEPTPRWGGLAIYAAILVALAIVSPTAYPRSPFPMYLVGIMVIGALVVVVGALDDLYQYKAKVQAVFLLAAGVAVQMFPHSGAWPEVQIRGFGALFGASSSWMAAGLLAVPITAIYIFVVAKTMDTIDGVDGLAAGIAAIAAATLSIIATYSVLNMNPEKAAELGRVYKELPRVALVAAAIAGAAIGFLRHNYNPAKIFMGTGGAQLLGFMLACISIVGVMKTAATVTLLVPVLVFGVPIFDATFVVVRRVLSRQPITQGDKRHLHHTLLSRGLSQRQTVLVLYFAAMVLCGLLLMVIKFYA